MPSRPPVLRASAMPERNSSRTARTPPARWFRTEARNSRRSERPPSPRVRRLRGTRRWSSHHHAGQQSQRHGLCCSRRSRWFRRRRCGSRERDLREGCGTWSFAGYRKGLPGHVLGDGGKAGDEKLAKPFNGVRVVSARRSSDADRGDNAAVVIKDRCCNTGAADFVFLELRGPALCAAAIENALERFGFR